MILNLTQHEPTPEQLAAGVMNLPAAARQELHRLLTFESIPSPNEIIEAARAIAALAYSEFVAQGMEPDGWHDSLCMIGGAPYLMSALEGALDDQFMKPLYAFSRREVVEQHLPDGSVKKSATFKHVGFVGSAMY